MRNSNAPYVFSAASALSHTNCGPSPYARACVVPQVYENTAACPEKALMQGTYFNDLAMTYTPADEWGCPCND